LYESCENQVSDALDAYTKALELDPNNIQIKQRLSLLKNPQTKLSMLQALPPQQPSPQENNQLRYPSVGGSAPANYRVFSVLMQAPGMDMNPSYEHKRTQSTDYRQYPPHYERRNSNTPQQISRAATPMHEEKDEMIPSKRRLAAVDSTDPKRYRPHQLN
jgi:hypothetical protein